MGVPTEMVDFSQSFGGHWSGFCTKAGWYKEENPSKREQGVEKQNNVG